MRRYYGLLFVLALVLGLAVGANMASPTVRTALADPTAEARVQVPALRSTAENWSSWVTAQNVGTTDTKAVFILWQASGFCPPQDLQRNVVNVALPINVIDPIKKHSFVSLAAILR